MANLLNEWVAEGVVFHPHDFIPQQAEREEENKLSVGFGNDMKLPKAWSPLKD